MKSGLEGRNNEHVDGDVEFRCSVSMKSGLEGRNNKKEITVDGFDGPESQ